jgi:hypothetical protein
MPMKPRDTDRIVIAHCILGDYAVIFWLNQPQVTIVSILDSAAASVHINCLDRSALCVSFAVQLAAITVAS